jgi:hypothetical protein
VIEPASTIDAPTNCADLIAHPRQSHTVDRINILRLILFSSEGSLVILKGILHKRFGSDRIANLRHKDVIGDTTTRPITNRRAAKNFMDSMADFASAELSRPLAGEKSVPIGRYRELFLTHRECESV